MDERSPVPDPVADAPSPEPEPAPPELRRRPWRTAQDLAVVLFLWAVTAAGRLDLSPSAPLIAAVLVLPYLYAVVGFGLVIRALRSSEGRIRWLPTGALAVSMLGLWGLAALPGRGARAGADEDPDTASLTVMTWNVGRLGRWARPEERRCQGEEAYTAVSRALETVRPDVLAIQEISLRNLARISADLALECEQIDYYGRGSAAAGGLAVCLPAGSPWSIRKGRSLPLPPDWHYVFTEICREEEGASRCFNVLGVHVQPYGVDFDELQRTGQALLAGRWEPLWELARLLERNVGTQGEQIREVLHILGTFRDPTLIAGDFNSTPDAAIHASLRGSLHDAWREAGRGRGSTRRVGGWLPLRIDYLYATSHFSILHTRTLPCTCADPTLSCSDHRAVVTRTLLAP